MTGLIIVGLAIAYLSAGVLVTTKSPSVLLPFSALGCLGGIVLAVAGAIIR